MQKLTINISDRVIRKLKALSALEGYTSPNQMESLASAVFEGALDDSIRCHLHSSNVPARQVATVASPEGYYNHAAEKSRYSDHDELSDGLGDTVEYDAKEPEPETDAYAMVPSKGGLSDKDLEQDMSVEDPQHEAKAEPPRRQRPDDNADDLFADIAFEGKPLSSDDDEIVDNWAPKRKKRVKHKAKVSMINDESHSSDACEL
jgi:hypothetical protein